jgi:hypothetical protein
MVNNYLSLELGGKARGLKFNVGTLRCFQTQFNIDPLQFKAESDDFKGILPFAEKILHAALLSNCLSKKEAPDFSAEDITEWIDELSGYEITKICTTWNDMWSAPKTTANGEVGKDTQPVNV